MKKEFIFAGCRERVSKNGSLYGDIFVFDKRADGKPDFEQMRFRTFDEIVLKNCRAMNSGDTVILDLFIKDAVVQGVDLSVEI